MTRASYHGTVNGYKRHKCRCARCRAAYRLYFRERLSVTGLSREEYFAYLKANPQRTHGRIATYNWGCRCALCTEASRLKQARYRAATRKRQATMTRKGT